MNRLRTVLILGSILGAVSCSKYQDHNCDNLKIRDKQLVTKAAVPDSEYVHLENPYSLDVMQGVYDTYSSTPVTLEATDLYVKFMPRDSIELERLVYDYELELFDYPLDIDIQENEEYYNPEIPESDLIWLYTTVPSDFVFPDDIPYQIIEECYIPETGEIIPSIATKTGFGDVDIERIAFECLGYQFENELITRTGSPSHPYGRVRFYDDTNANYVPLKGVKVRCHKFVKVASAFTNDSGYYYIGKTFRTSVSYSIVFENTKGFTLWSSFGFVAKQRYGSHLNTGYSPDISSDDSPWEYAAVNNAAYEYYSMCTATEIMLPPDNLKILVSSSCGNSSPLLRLLSHNLHSAGYDVLDFFAAFSAGVPILSTVFKNCLPDITIKPYYSNDSKYSYEDIYEVVNHELAHASHYSKAGTSYWNRYVKYIIACKLNGDSEMYGDGTRADAGVCAVGEMWGYFMGYVQHIEKFDSNGVQVNTPYPDTIGPVAGWIYPVILWELYSHEVLSKSEIYDCLQSNVDTVQRLYDKMIFLYPDKAEDIEAVFVTNGMMNFGYFEDLNYDEIYSNWLVTYPYSWAGENIMIEDIYVTNNKRLTVRGFQSVTVKGPISIDAGAQMEIRRGYS